MGDTRDPRRRRFAALDVIEIVSATRLSEEAFWAESALGVSLRRLAGDPRLAPCIFFRNGEGLPKIYNSRIQSPDSREVLAFMHDDVWIDDLFFADHVMHGLAVFDVVGVAGNRRRKDGQPGWAFIDDECTWDDAANLSGAVAHDAKPFGPVSFYGTVPAECELLDGVLLAARKSTLVKSRVEFDTRFDFHFYDMDFCRTARKRDLCLGTWPISLTHQSAGGFRAPAWQAKLAEYRRKWGA